MLGTHFARDSHLRWASRFDCILHRSCVRTPVAHSAFIAGQENTTATVDRWFSTNSPLPFERGFSPFPPFLSASSPGFIKSSAKVGRHVTCKLRVFKVTSSSSSSSLACFKQPRWTGLRSGLGGSYCSAELNKVNCSTELNS